MEFTNIDVVTIAIFLLGGDTKRIDTEDIAIKSNELAPGRFTWRKFPDQINIDNIRKRLSDAKNPHKGKLIEGNFKDGWTLTLEGLSHVKNKLK